MSFTVVTTCSSRKAFPASTELEGRALTPGSLDAVGRQWLHRVDNAFPVCRAADLYRGRGFGYAVKACPKRSPFTVSAGLGFLRPDELVPSYGLTVAAAAPDDDVFKKIRSRRNPADWWSVVRQSRFSASLLSAFDGGGLVLMALSSPYLAMISSDLEALPDSDIERLRIFMPGSPDVPTRLISALMPYDNRLNLPGSELRGPLTDFAARATLHFATAILPDMPTASPSAHAEAICDWLANLEERPHTIEP